MLSRLSLAALLVGQALAKKISVPYTETNLIPLQQNAGSDDLFPMGDCFGFDLHEATITEMQEAMRLGHLTSTQLVTCYLVRTYQTQEYIECVARISYLNSRSRLS